MTDSVGNDAGAGEDAVVDYLTAQNDKGLLRFITCGSVDDGKSTLIGRLLYDSKLIFEDQLAALRNDSRKYGTQAGEIDLALLVDGLAAEREQGITIDVAYRFFATERRKFIVADTPGHEQYTRNMATGASNADFAVILVDARQGILTQTRRHSHILSLLGIKRVALAVNKMDLVDFAEARFVEIAAAYQAFADQLGLVEVTAIPVCALSGDNVLAGSDRMAWYKGPSLIELLESVDVHEDLEMQPLRMPVQWVNRPDENFRGYAGTIAAGTARPGDDIVVLPSGQTGTIARIVTMDCDQETAAAGLSVTLTLAQQIDISRGDIIAAATDRPEVSDQFQANIIWMHEDELLPGRSYFLKTANATVPAVVTELRHQIDVNSFEREACKSLPLNGIAECNISLSRPIPFEKYATSRALGSFILIDRLSNETVGAGMINFGLRRATNIHWQAVDVNKASRAGSKDQKPCILWFTGLSGSGKSTIANQLEKLLVARDRHTYLLDGDNVRHGLNRDLGFTDADRVENIRRVGETAKLMVDAGLITLVSFISPFRAERRMVREMVEEGEFIEIFVDTPIEVCEQRDPKGLYEKVRRGEIKNFTGFDSPYEAPEQADIRIDTVTTTADQAAQEILSYIEARQMLNGDIS